MFSIKKKTLAALFFISLLTTEFFYIQAGSGTARIYHFGVLLVVLFLIFRLPRLLASPVFTTLLIFWIINVVAAALSTTPRLALASSVLLTANIGIATATALILVSGRFDWLALRKLILAITFISIGWALLQLIVFRTTGFSLALSVEQEKQILMGLAPSFRTEANTFGKYLMLPFLLFLPEYIHGGRTKNMTLFYVVLMAGIFSSFTRTAIYGIGLTLLFIFFWYSAHGRISAAAKKIVTVGTLAVIGLSVFASGMLNVSEYALHKIDAFFSSQEILEGGSSAFRLMVMQNTLDAFLANDKTMLIGNGWGQIYMTYGKESIQTGGGDLLTALGYGGLLGGGSYLLVMLFAFLAAMKVARSKSDPHKARFAEGVMFALLGLFITGQMSGFMIAPEFWMLIGIAIYLSIRPRRTAPIATSRLQET